MGGDRTLLWMPAVLGGCIASSTTAADKQRTIDALEAQLGTCRDQVAQRDDTTASQAHEVVSAAPVPSAGSSSAAAAGDDRPHPPAPDGAPHDWLRETSLRGRLELDGSYGYALTAATAQRDEIGAALRYYVTDALGVGLDARDYTNATHRIAADWPQHETAWSADLDFLYGPFASTRVPLVRDLYVLGGVGVVATRPLAVIDPSRSFAYKDALDVVAGFGARVFVWPWLAANLELRDTIYDATVENPQISSNPSDPRTWNAPTGAITDDVSLDFSFSLFFPFVARR